MKILNLGCGFKASPSPDMVNIDWSIYLQLRKNPAWRAITPLLLNRERLDRFNRLPDNILVHNLAKGIPFATDSVDVVYHSHLLEHIDRHASKPLLLEVKRVLKPNGVHRIVVPDLEGAARTYIEHLAACENDPTEVSKHDSHVAHLLEQSVRRESYGTSQQKPLRRFIENLCLGDARRRGETHQWMYDRFNLKELLISLGFRNSKVQSYKESLIPNWFDYGLEIDENGNEYKPGSLYMEAQK